MSSGLEDGLDSESRQSFSNVMRECPIQVLERSERTARMHGSLWDDEVP